VILTVLAPVQADVSSESLDLISIVSALQVGKPVYKPPPFHMSSGVVQVSMFKLVPNFQNCSIHAIFHKAISVHQLVVCICPYSFTANSFISAVVALYQDIVPIIYLFKN